MYIITDINITLLSINSVHYKDKIEDAKLIFLDRISEHLYDYYNIILDMKLSDILSENIYMINNNMYLEKNKSEENLIEVFVYKKVKKGFIINMFEKIVTSVFQLKFEVDLVNSTKTIEYVKIN